MRSTGDVTFRLSADQWTQVDALLDELLDVPEGERLACLRARAVEDTAVRAEVASLLRAVHASAGFLSLEARPPAHDLAPDATVGTVLGAWRLSRLIGRGGMGDVYEAARDSGDFEQRVAVKLLRMESAVQAQRFQAERQILARLAHAGIARLYDGGVSADGRPYMVMEYVEGRPITEHCAIRHASLSERLELFIQVCAAVAYAHRNQIVHRDLKPSNILVTAAGCVKLLDFGIAKLLDAQMARLTQAAAPMTPICAAPEQLTGQPITAATDVYALGLLLFELLTGRHPWMGPDTPILQAMRTVLHGPAPVASRVAEASGVVDAHAPVPPRSIRGDLDAIVAKALRREPELRYPTAAELESDVGRVGRGEPVAARAGARLYLLSRTLRRHRSVAVVVLLVSVAWVAALTAVQWEAKSAAQRVSPAVPAVPPRSVAFLGLNNLSGNPQDSWVAAALTQMLGTELGVADHVHVIPDERVRDLLPGMPTTTAGGDAPETLARIAARLGADYVVTGSYLVSPAANDPPLRVDLQLRAGGTGAPVAVFSRQTVVADLAGVATAAGSELRGKLGVNPASGASLETIATTQPPFADVARHLGRASEFMDHHQPAMARDEALEAIAESPGYAPAYLRLSEAWSALGYRQKAVAAAEQAASHAAGLLPEQRLQVDAMLRAFRYEWSKAADDWKSLIALRPDNPEYRLQAIDALISSGAAAAAQPVLAELRGMANQSSDPRVESAAARIANALNDFPGAVDHARESLRLAQSRDAPGLIGAALMQLATAQENLGQTEAALAGFKSAAGSYHDIDNPRGEADAHRGLALLQSARHQLAEARQDYERAMALYRRIGDAAGMTVVYINLCEMLWNAGDRDGAQAAARHGLETSREIGDLKLQAWTLRALATVEADESASDEVMGQYRDGINLTGQIGDRGGHVWSLATYADAARTRGDMRDALATCRQTLTEATQLSDVDVRAYAEFSCAQVALDHGESAVATAALEHVKQQAQASGNSIYLGNALMTLAQLDREESRCPQALGRLHEAVKVFAAAEANTGQADAEALIALCAQDVGDTGERDRALAHARALRAGINSRLEVYFVDMVSARFGAGAGSTLDAIARLQAIAADASRRHWLVWSLEAKLEAWQLARDSGDVPVAARLRRDLQVAARAHDLGRIRARIGDVST